MHAQSALRDLIPGLAAVWTASHGSPPACYQQCGVLPRLLEVYLVAR